MFLAAHAAKATSVSPLSISPWIKPPPPPTFYSLSLSFSPLFSFLSLSLSLSRSLSFGSGMCSTMGERISTFCKIKKKHNKEKRCPIIWSLNTVANCIFRRPFISKTNIVNKITQLFAAHKVSFQSVYLDWYSWPALEHAPQLSDAPAYPGMCVSLIHKLRVTLRKLRNAPLLDMSVQTKPWPRWMAENERTIPSQRSSEVENIGTKKNPIAVSIPLRKVMCIGDDIAVLLNCDVQIFFPVPHC